MRYIFLASLAVVLILCNIVSAHTVTMNLALRIGNNVNNTIHVNGTDYNVSTPNVLTFTSDLGKRYMAANNTTTLAVLVPAGQMLSARLNTSYNATHYLFQVTQSSDANRFLIAVTNGTYSDIEDKLSMVDAFHMVSSSFGRLVKAVPSQFTTFIRLEYTNIDIGGRAVWSGNGQLQIKNRGTTDRNLQNVTIEVIR